MKLLSNKFLWLFFLVLGLHLFMRVYNFEQLLGYGHDEDLAGWIIKDIVVDHHFRLIGQETSVDGLFIGPTFYYLETLFFILFKLDPIGGYFLTLTISILTLFGFYYVFNRFFGNKIALFGTLIYAGSLSLVNFDKWVVPTQPTLLWSIWFLYCLFSLMEGDFKVLAILGILFGFIWHVHIALVPLTLLIFPALYFSKKRSNPKQFFFNRYFLIGLIFLIILVSPFFLFEVKHGFIQTKGLLTASIQDRNSISGFPRVLKILDGISQGMLTVFYGGRLNNTFPEKVFQAISLILVTVFLLVTRKNLGKRFWIIVGWFLLVFLGQMISKRTISEYYFANLNILIILITAVFLNKLNSTFPKKNIAFLLISIFVITNLTFLMNLPPDNEGYLVRKKVVSFIKFDSTLNNYPCFAINYITWSGKNAGYHYFFFLNNLKIITPGNDVSVYSIVNPTVISSKEIEYSQGSVGIITPKNFQINPSSCTDPARQLLPLWGFNN